MCNPVAGVDNTGVSRPRDVSETRLRAPLVAQQDTILGVFSVASDVALSVVLQTTQFAGVRRLCEGTRRRIKDVNPAASIVL